MQNFKCQAKELWKSREKNEARTWKMGWWKDSCSSHSCQNHHNETSHSWSNTQWCKPAQKLPDLHSADGVSARIKVNKNFCKALAASPCPSPVLEVQPKLFKQLLKILTHTGIMLAWNILYVAISSDSTHELKILIQK